MKKITNNSTKSRNDSKNSSTCPSRRFGQFGQFGGIFSDSIHMDLHQVDSCTIHTAKEFGDEHPEIPAI
jgi:hypothetical protein